MTPKTPKPPPVPAPAAVPQDAPQTSDQAVEKQRRKSGFEKTVMTGSLSPSTGKKTTLGG